MKPTAEKRFWIRVEKTDSCWLWIGWKDKDGYGCFKAYGKNRRAHRFSYELRFGTIPKGLAIDHLCRVRNCVNPNHLEPVLPGINTLRGFGLGALNKAKTHCKHGHLLSGDNLRTDGKRRECVECRRNITRRFRARNAHK